MKDGIGGTAQGHVHGQSIFKGLLGQDLVRCDILLQKLHDFHPGFLGQPDSFGHGFRDGAVAGKGHADGFGQAVHGIGREHAGAGPAGGTG